jgi:hypothetical protein
MSTHYQPSLLTGNADSQGLANGLTVGMRFHSAPAVRLSDAKPLHLGHVHKADGRWRIYAFADRSTESQLAPKLEKLLDYLDNDPKSPLNRFTPKSWDRDGVFDLRAIYQEHHRDLTIEQMHPLLRPPVGKYGLRDYEKVLTSDHTGGRDIFDLRQISREAGALVVVRPDMYVAQVLPLGAHEELAAFFAGFMLDQ